MSYKLKYTGSQIDDLLDKIAAMNPNDEKTITLDANSWVDNELTYSDSWIEEGYVYMMSYGEGSRDAFISAGIWCDTETAGNTLTFHADTTPADDVAIILAKVGV